MCCKKSVTTVTEVSRNDILRKGDQHGLCSNQRTPAKEWRP